MNTNALALLPAAGAARRAAAGEGVRAFSGLTASAHATQVAPRVAPTIRTKDFANASPSGYCSWSPPV